MAKNEPVEPQKPPEFSDIDKSKARQWFKKATDLRERHNHDFAIECYITGLNFWPEAVEDGHKPLSSLSLQRQQAGGKKAGMMEAMKKSINGKDFKLNMLNAEFLLSKDPNNSTYLDGLLKNANKAGYTATVCWISTQVLESLRRDKKPSPARFKNFKDAMLESAERADLSGDGETASWLYERALQANEYLMVRSPGDMSLRDEQRNLSGKLTITKGKYSSGDSFRDSIKDSEKQKQLHDVDRLKQGEDTYRDMIATARKDLVDNPGVPAKINTLVDALLKSERDAEETEALDILAKAAKETGNYSFIAKADDVRMRQARRRTRHAREVAEKSGADADKVAARQLEKEELALEIKVFTERVQKYPTDQRMKFRLGQALFKRREFDAAIPLLQAAQSDPRHRLRAQLLLGLCFYEQKLYGPAADVLKDALNAYEGGDDDLERELLYRLGRACEADGQPAEAKAAYGKLVRMDYAYANGDARRRLDSLSKAG